MTGRCRECKTALSQGAEVARERKFTVDEAGGAWWEWTKAGTVLVSGKDRAEALIALGRAVKTGAVFLPGDPCPTCRREGDVEDF
jgi:hypothetical protein